MSKGISALLIVAVSPVMVWAAPTYRFTDLGTFGGDSSEALAINNNGHVVGWAQTAATGTVSDYDWRTGTWSTYTGTIQTRNAFVYDRGEMIDLADPRCTRTAMGVSTSASPAARR